MFITDTFINPYDSRVEPDVNQLLLDAGPLVNQVGDGRHPVEYRWTFDPPFALPHRGKFFLDIQASEYSSWLIPAAKTGPYPEGEAWSTTASWDCARPGGLFGDDPLYLDLAFEVRFCGGVTGVGNPSIPQALAFYGRGGAAQAAFVIELPRDATVTVRAYDARGREVARLADGLRPAGVYRFALSGAGASLNLPSGVYFARATIQSSGAVETRTARAVSLR